MIRFQDEDQIHSLPVSQMGNYQEYLKRLPVPLRELENAPVRQHMFGNPFKLDKSRGMMIDEANDIDLVGSGGASPVRSPKRQTLETPPASPHRSKRRPGPLPRDFSVNRSFSPTPPSTPSQSPSPPPEPQMDVDETPKGSFIPIKNGSDHVHFPANQLLDGYEPAVRPDQPSISVIGDRSRVPPMIPNDVEFARADRDHDLDSKRTSPTPATYSNNNTNNAARISPPVINGDKYNNGSDANGDTVVANGPTTLRHAPPALHQNGKRIALTKDELELRRSILRLVKKPGKSKT